MFRVRLSRRKCAQFAQMLVVAILLTASCPTLAMYDRLSIEHVPIERVINNLNEQIAAKPNLRGQNEFKIARLYAMAFALNDDRLPVNNRFGALHQDSQTWLSQSSYDDVIYSTDHSQLYPEFRQFKNEPGVKTESAIKCLQVAIEHYKVALKLDQKNDDIKLGLAWCLQQNNDRVEAIRLYREIISKQIDANDHGTTISQRAFECVQYLIPMLDTKADKDEIKKLSTFPKPDYSPHFITPIVIPLVSKLNPDSVMRVVNVLFDLGEGPRLYSSWPSKSAGWLVYDRGNSGSIKTGYQMFGNYTFFLFWKNGYEALSSLDNNQDGKLEGGELEDLAVWSDKNCDGKSTKDEIHTLTQLGVISISCVGTLDRQNMLTCEKGISFATGESRKTYDFILRETSEKSLVQSRPENKL